MRNIQTLSALAKTIRSKNAGVDKITFDVIFKDRESYDRVRKSRALTRETIAELYRFQRAGFRISWNSTLRLPSSSRFIESDPAAAPVTAISSDRSNTHRCWIWGYRLPDV